MRQARVSNHGRPAGTLEELDDGSFRFTYDPLYVTSTFAPISLTLPKREEPYVAPHLFGFFYGMLAEGSTREIQHRALKIDESDHMGLLMATTSDTVGSVSIEPMP